MFDKENLMRIEYTNKFAGKHSVEMVALYNKKRISEKEVKDVIQTEMYNPYVIIIEKEKFEKVFIA